MQRAIFFIIAVLMAFITTGAAWAVQPDEVLPDPVLEARAREISGQLRCLVCQNETIDDSNASLARDLRLLVRERLVAGDSNDETINYIVARYGEYVLLKPRFRGATVLLWLSPVFILLLVLGYLFITYRRRDRVRHAPLTVEEEERLIRLLDDEAVAAYKARKEHE